MRKLAQVSVISTALPCVTLLLIAAMGSPGCERSASSGNSSIGWIEKLGGLAVRDQADRVIYVNLASTPARDEHLKRLSRFHHLRTLHLEHTGVTDTGLKHLVDGGEGQGTSLRELYLNRTNVTNAGLKHLAKLASLRKLSLTGTPITDAGLPELCPMKELRLLEIGNYYYDGRGRIDRAPSMLRNLGPGEVGPDGQGPGLEELLACCPEMGVQPR